ncbi:MAG: lipopolysaccharide biosynthesis protein [Tannerellaceae bacterium]|nr:lipopolysaccharide biosynthesis protein [Tannerellaceae bacterium]
MPEISLKEKTAKGLFWGGFSNGVQQVLVFVFGIFLARILSPADYGVVGMLAIFTGIANALQEGGFIAALTNRKNISHEDYNAVFWFNVFAGIILYAVLFLSAPLIALFFNKPELTGVSRIVFLSFLFNSLGTTQSAYLFKNLMVKERAKIDIFSLLLSNTLALFMALQGMAYWGIAIQVAFYSGIGTLLRWFYSTWRPTFTFKLQPLKEMFPFSINLLLTNIFTQISANIFSVILGKFFTDAQVGYFTQSNKWMIMGKGLIAGAITGIAQPVLTEVIDEKERQLHIFRKMIRFTCFLSFPLMFGLAFISHEFILLTVTEKWLPCVPILQILCIWGAFSPLSDLYKNLIISHSRSKVYLLSNIVFSILQLGLILLFMSYGLLWMVVAYTIAYFLYLLFWHLYAEKIIPVTILQVVKDISPYLFTILLAILTSFFLTHHIENLYIKMLLKIVATAVIYTGILWKAKSVILYEVIRFFLNRLNKKRQHK